MSAHTLDWRTERMLLEKTTRELIKIATWKRCGDMGTIRMRAAAKRALKIRLAHYTPAFRAEVRAMMVVQS